jgi:hypothetical protein
MGVTGYPRRQLRRFGRELHCRTATIGWVRRAAHLGHRAIAIPDQEAAIRALRLTVEKNLQEDVDFRKPRSSF